MNQNEFMLRRQAAVDRMREMNARAVNSNICGQKKTAAPQNKSGKTEPAKGSLPHLQPEPSKQKRQENTSFQNSFNLPFLEALKKDSDTTLIIGLLLILMSEKSDKFLLFALVYILL